MPYPTLFDLLEINLEETSDKIYQLTTSPKGEIALSSGELFLHSKALEKNQRVKYEARTRSSLWKADYVELRFWMTCVFSQTVKHGAKIVLPDPFELLKIDILWIYNNLRDTGSDNGSVIVWVFGENIPLFYSSQEREIYYFNITLESQQTIRR